MANNEKIIKVYHLFKGVIRISSVMDRELQDEYWVIIQAKTWSACLERCLEQPVC